MGYDKRLLAEAVLRGNGLDIFLLNYEESGRTVLTGCAPSCKECPLRRLCSGV